MLKVLLLFFGFWLVDANAATTIDGGSFDTIYDALKAWIGGSLGYTIALLGTFSFIIWYWIGAGGHLGGSDGEGKRLFLGILFSLLVGGVVGMVNTMINLGANTFN